jgi:hypothetical protein
VRFWLGTVHQALVGLYATVTRRGFGEAEGAERDELSATAARSSP